MPKTFDLFGRVGFFGQTNDAFEIYLRTDGRIDAEGRFTNGIRVKFIGTTDPRSIGFKTVSIEIPPNRTLVETNFNTKFNAYFYFRIADDGTVVHFYWSRTESAMRSGPLHTLIIPDRAGDKLRMVNRRTSTPTSPTAATNLVKLDYVRVSDFPAPYRFSPTTGFSFLFKGKLQRLYVAEYSTNLIDWTRLVGFRPGPNGYLVTDNPISLPHRFYRVRTGP